MTLLQFNRRPVVTYLMYSEVVWTSFKVLTNCWYYVSVAVRSANVAVSAAASRVAVVISHPHFTVGYQRWYPNHSWWTMATSMLLFLKSNFSLCRQCARRLPSWAIRHTASGFLEVRPYGPQIVDISSSSCVWRCEAQKHQTLPPWAPWGCCRFPNLRLWAMPQPAVSRSWFFPLKSFTSHTWTLLSRARMGSRS